MVFKNVITGMSPEHSHMPCMKRLLGRVSRCVPSKTAIWPVSGGLQWPELSQKLYGGNASGHGMDHGGQRGCDHWGHGDGPGGHSGHGGWVNGLGDYHPNDYS